MKRTDCVTIYLAKKVITMDPHRPLATAVAVCEGKILSIGEGQSIISQMNAKAHLFTYDIDDTFENKIIVPGFIEAHMHFLMEGLLWQHVYVGYHDRVTPNNAKSKGCRTRQAVIKKLNEFYPENTRKTQGPLIGWGYDPSVLDRNQLLTLDDLDMVSKTRAVCIINASGHIYYVNKFLLNLARIDSSTNVVGVVKDQYGIPTGELQELTAAALVFPHLFKSFGSENEMNTAIFDAAKIGHRAGCTTVTDWAFGEFPGSFDAYKLAFMNDSNHLPMRIVLAPLDIYLLEQGRTAEGAIRFLEELINTIERSESPDSAESVDRLFIGPVKIIVDGSIQGFTAALKWPGYYNGQKNGIINRSLQDLKETLLPFHKAGLRLTFHTNGDQAVDNALDVIEYILTESPRPDHRLSLEHAQIISNSQFKRIAAMKINLNFFSGHIYYWGDFHSTETLGPDRASQMDAAASAKNHEIHFSLHSDSPITPVNPLFSAWCAVNRITQLGTVLGSYQKISVEDALRAITIEAAFLLQKDDIIGSIEVGKYADFTILEEDPLFVNPERLKDIKIWGTVFAGIKFPIET